MKKVKPRPGIILASIPETGAEVTDELAREWQRNGLVIIVEDEKKPPAKAEKESK